MIQAAKALRVVATATLAALVLHCPRSSAFARDLTPGIRSLLRMEARSVKLVHDPATIALDGTDYWGYYKCPYFRVYVNGRGPFTFLFDSGSSFSILSSKVIDAAGVAVVFHRGGYHDIVLAKTVRIGNVRLEDLYATRDDSGDVDGILGFNAFGNRDVTLRLGQREMQISSEPVALTGSFQVPYIVSHFTPDIDASTGTAIMRILIDTGDDAYPFEVRSVDVRGLPLERAPVRASDVVNFDTGVTATTLTTLASTLRIGPIRVPNPVVAINDGLDIGDLGVDFLREFNIEFIPAKRVLVFQPLFRGTTLSIGGQLTPGFWMSFHSHPLKVNAVIPGSSAEQAGLRVGDVVSEINGESADAYNPRTWDALMILGTTVRIVWSDASAQHSGDFVITELR